MRKPMLMRLQSVLGCDDLTQQMVLLPQNKISPRRTESSNLTLNIVVGYSGSDNSQAALDMALWIAHQTRLVKQNPVLVHIVYVIDQVQPATIEKADHILWQARCLASEWRGSLDAHLRIGNVATELSKTAQEMDAEVMLLGCRTLKHPLVKQLANQTPCPILGLLPKELSVVSSH